MQDRDWHPGTRASWRSSCSALVLPAVYGGWCSGPSGHRLGSGMPTLHHLPPLIQWWPCQVNHMKNNLTAEEVRYFFDYDRETGNLIRRVVSKYSRRYLNRVAGSVYTTGYRVVSVPGGRRFSAHRLIWLWVYGEWPKYEIDHINGDRLDNRISNLRDVPTRTNVENCRAPHRDSKHAILGSTWIEKRKSYQVAIQVHGVQHYLGLFKDPEAARNAYIEAKRRLHVGCTI